MNVSIHKINFLNRRLCTYFTSQLIQFLWFDLKMIFLLHIKVTMNSEHFLNLKKFWIFFIEKKKYINNSPQTHKYKSNTSKRVISSFYKFRDSSIVLIIVFINYVDVMVISDQHTNQLRSTIVDWRLWA